MSIAHMEDRSLRCPNTHDDHICGGELYVRHTEAGTLDQVQGRHYITNVIWEAECHICQWKSPRRSTEWALIRTILNESRTNSDS